MFAVCSGDAQGVQECFRRLAPVSLLGKNQSPIAGNFQKPDQGCLAGIPAAGNNEVAIFTVLEIPVNGEGE